MRQVMNVIVVALLALPAVVLGQADDVSRVIAELKAALGGADRVAAVKSLTATGRTLRTNAGGTTTENEFELAMELPDKYMLRTVLANMGNMSVYRNAGFNGHGLINLIDQPPMLGGGGGMMVVRAVGAGGGSASPTPEQQAETNRRMLVTQKHEFARLTLAMFGSSFDGFPLSLSYAGEAEAADGKAWMLDATGADDFAARLFIDTKSGLPLMMSWSAPEPLVMQQTMGRGAAPPSEDEQRKMMEEAEARMKAAEANRRNVEYRVYYADFKTVGGVKLPHRMQRSIDGKPAEEMTFDQFRINPRIDARKFEVTR